MYNRWRVIQYGSAHVLCLFTSVPLTFMCFISVAVFDMGFRQSYFPFLYPLLQLWCHISSFVWLLAFIVIKCSWNLAQFLSECWIEWGLITYIIIWSLTANCFSKLFGFWLWCSKLWWNSVWWNSGENLHCFLPANGFKFGCWLLFQTLSACWSDENFPTTAWVFILGLGNIYDVTVPVASYCGKAK